MSPDLQSREHLPYITTSLGTRWYHSDPRPEDVHIEFIAHALARLCRFAGHVNVPMYSVAEHSVRVSYACPPEHQLWGLLHDCAESVCVDVPRPLKHIASMDVYRKYEKLSQAAMMKHFGLPLEEPKEVKLADTRLLATEYRDLMPMGDAIINAEPYPDKIEPWTTEEAERRFLVRYYELSGKKLMYFYLEQWIEEMVNLSSDIWNSGLGKMILFGGLVTE